MSAIESAAADATPPPADQGGRGLRQVEVSLSKAEFRACVPRIVQAINDGVAIDGIPLDTVLYAALYVIGSAIAQRGGVLDFSASLETALTPLTLGYSDARKRKCHD